MKEDYKFYMLLSAMYCGTHGRGSPRPAPFIAAGNPQPVNRGDPPEGEVYSNRGLSADGIPMYIGTMHGVSPPGNIRVPGTGIYPDVNRVRAPLWNGIKDAGPPGREIPWVKHNVHQGKAATTAGCTQPIPVYTGRANVMYQSRRFGIYTWKYRTNESPVTVTNEKE